MQRTLRAGWHNVNSNPPKNKKRHLAGWLALCQPYQVKPIRHKTLTNVTLQAGRYDVNHCCHINSKPPTKNKKCNVPCGLAGTTTAARRAATHHSHRRILQENQMKNSGLILMKTFFCEKNFCEKFYLTQREFSSCKNFRLFCLGRLVHV